MNIIQQVVSTKQSDWSTRNVRTQIRMTACLTHYSKYYSTKSEATLYLSELSETTKWIGLLLILIYLAALVCMNGWRRMRRTKIQKKERFVPMSHEELNQLELSRNKQTTSRSTSWAVRCFQGYLKSTKQDVDLDHCNQHLCYNLGDKNKHFLLICAVWI